MPFIIPIWHQNNLTPRWWFLLLLVFAFGDLMGQDSSNDNKAEMPLLNLLNLLEEKHEIAFLFKPDVLYGKYISLRTLPELSVKPPFFKALSEQTNLEFKHISKGFMAVRAKYDFSWLRGYVYDDKGEKLTGVSIKVEGTKRGSVTDEQGHFEIKIPAGEQLLQLSYIGYKTLSKSIRVPYGSDVVSNFVFKDPVQLDEVLVVGSRAKPKTQMESAVPVDVITQEEIARLPQWELSQLLHYLAPSFHSTHQTISDGTDHIDPATLRGLGPDQVLVLINGKRRHHSALVNVNGTIGRGSVGTDLNAIPLNAIKRIEVLRDGAAAQYGSDAIAGVINLVLEDAISGGKVQSQIGIAQEGDGKTFSLGGGYGLKLLKSGGFARISLQYNQREAINRSGAYAGPIFNDERDNDQKLLDAFFNQTGYDKNRVMSVGSAAVNNFGLFFNLNLPVDQKIAIYANGGLNYRLGRSAGFYRFPYQERRQSGLFPLGFSPQIWTDILDYSTTIGLKAEHKGWQIDFSNNFGENSFNFTIKNSNNASMGLNSPTAAHAGGFDYRQNTANLDIFKRLEGTIPINVALGGEFRLENYRQHAGDQWSWQHYGAVTSIGEPKEAGIQVFPGFRPENESNNYRFNIGAYADLEATVNKKLLIGVATRFENYSDFGGNWSGKIAGRYRLTERITFRATYNTGFRAPSMPQIYFSSLSLQFIPIGMQVGGVQVAHANSESNLTHLLGIESLEAERSFNWSGGLTTQIGENFKISADAYHIKIKDRIVLSGRISATEVPPFAPILESVGISRVQFFTNAVDTRTIGMDVKLAYAINLSESKANLFAAFNLNQTKVLEINAPSILEGFEKQLFNREEIGRLEVAQPRNKLILGASYVWNDWQISLQTTRFGEVGYIHPNDGNETNWVFNPLTESIESRDQFFSPKWVTDMSLHWQLQESFSIGLTASNIFNILPDEHTHAANISHGIFRYSRNVQQFGVTGAFWSLKMRLSFS